MVGERGFIRSPQVMCLRCVVPKTHGIPSVPSRSLVNKRRSRPTHSESTLPQLLIPLDFNSCISSVYKKPRGQGPSPATKVLQLVSTHSPFLGPHTNARQPHSSQYFTSYPSGYPRVAPSAHKPGQSPLLGCAAGHGTRATLPPISHVLYSRPFARQKNFPTPRALQ